VVVDDEDCQALERTLWRSGHGGGSPKLYRGRPARRRVTPRTPRPSGYDGHQCPRV